MAKSARSNRAKRRIKAKDLQSGRGGATAKKMSAVNGGVYFNPKELTTDRPAT